MSTERVDREELGYRLLGAQCSRCGKSTAAMDRDELIAFIGFLDELATERADVLREVGTWESRGDRISDAWDMMHVPGAWAGLIGHAKQDET